MDVRALLQRAWTDRGALACALWPLSLAYRLLAALHHGLYRSGLLHATQVPVPVIVVGNVVAGGAGKTPVVMAVIRHLRQRGLHPGVVSRGYGRAGATVCEVLPHSDAAAVGDEPLLLARRAGVPVFVAPRRADAAAALLAAHPQVNVIVSDDGLQHHALARDIEICVFDARGAGNGWLLPAGPLREPWPRPVNLLLQPAPATLAGAFTVRRKLAAHAERADGSQVALQALRGQACAAVAGIAQPQAFFDMLRGAGLTLAVAMALPDHHGFALAPSGIDPTLPLLCTEKDAVKLWRQVPQALAVPLELQIEPGFWQALDGLLAPKLSSPHGSETA